MTEVPDTQEPMAKVCYDFPSKAWPGVQIRGSIEIRESSRAKAIADAMNAEWGEGTHWVETLNYTYAERISSWE